MTVKGQHCGQQLNVGYSAFGLYQSGMCSLDNLCDNLLDTCSPSPLYCGPCNLASADFIGTKVPAYSPPNQSFKIFSYNVSGSTATIKVAEENRVTLYTANQHDEERYSDVANNCSDNNMFML
jgi:hypothetical protein